jgi:hypothetical protein
MRDFYIAIEKFSLPQYPSDHGTGSSIHLPATSIIIAELLVTPTEPVTLGFVSL